MTEFEVEAPELFHVATEALVGRADSLGLTWGLRPATVTTVSSATVTAIYDGDTAAISMFPLVGGLYVGARVMAVKVPPSGNYILGVLGGGHGTFCLGANVTTQGVVATTPAGAEIAVPSGSWDAEPTFTFRNEYVFQVQATGIMGVTTDQQVGAIRVRVGSGSTSGTQLCQFNHQVSGVFVSPTFSDIGYFVNSSGADVATQLSLTINRIGGLGNMSLAGDTSTRLAVAVYQIGPFVQLPSLAPNLASV